MPQLEVKPDSKPLIQRDPKTLVVTVPSDSFYACDASSCK